MAFRCHFNVFTNTINTYKMYMSPMAWYSFQVSRKLASISAWVRIFEESGIYADKFQAGCSLIESLKTFPFRNLEQLLSIPLQI
jgi:hypothetical protein